MKPLILVSLIAWSGCSHIAFRTPASEASGKKSAEAAQYPILVKLENLGQALYGDTALWMTNWLGMDLEQTDLYRLPGMTGSTSVNLKIEKVDSAAKKGVDPLGIFLAPNSSGNPTAELAYFNMSAILGWDKIFRPAARYQLGPKASQEFLTLIQAGLTCLSAKGKTCTISSDQQDNANKIVTLINAGGPLQGCLKAEKDKTANPVDSMCNTNLGDNGGPDFTKPVVASLQITNPAPVAGTQVTLLAAGVNNPGDPAYVGDALELAVEYSVIMTLDAIFQQGDRYSGGNLVARLDPKNQAHFYSTDNGGASLQTDPTSVTMNLNWFSRYDRKTIAKLRQINQFLLKPEIGFMGYQDAVAFVTDLGFYFEMDPATSTSLLQRNIQMLLMKVDSVVAQYGDGAYLN